MIAFKIDIRQLEKGLHVEVNASGADATEAEGKLARALRESLPKLIQELAKPVFGPETTSFVAEGRPQQN